MLETLLLAKNHMNSTQLNDVMVGPHRVIQFGC